MQFRKDINGLRALAVIAVVIFHFSPGLLTGGFAGVDVFFVISGFLMTGIIFKGLNENTFSLWRFYIARVNRIIPALAILCIVLLALGWLYLLSGDYKILGKHIFSSLSFISNFVYWRESGYFDSASHEKWLLHTWSLSVEWQFYILYPIILVFLKKYFSLESIKKLVLYTTVLGFTFSVIATNYWPNSSYYMLSTRAWEMMVGGVAFLFVLKVKEKNRSYVEFLGVSLILISYFMMSKDNAWPGYMALLPVLGAFLVIKSENDSIILGNVFFQKIGTWSYSIYLWHWPIVVLFYKIDFDGNLALIAGSLLSVFFGFLSYTFVESKLRFKANLRSPIEFILHKPVMMTMIVGMLAVIVFANKGINDRYLLTEQQNKISAEISPSPYRNKCHSSMDNYLKPEDVCSFFGGDITWATLGDSHTVEIAYALAKTLEKEGYGLKQFSFSGCEPSYGMDDTFSNCANWTNDSVKAIVNDDKIKNVVINYRYSSALFGDNVSISSDKKEKYTDVRREKIIYSIDLLIKDLAKEKDNVFVFLPIPELTTSINNLVTKNLIYNNGVINIIGVDRDYYNSRNEYILNYFSTAKFPQNVTIVDPTKSYCDSKTCYSVKDGTPLYFDDDHPSIVGSEKLVRSMIKFKDRN